MFRKYYKRNVINYNRYIFSKVCTLGNLMMKLLVYIRAGVIIDMGWTIDVEASTWRFCKWYISVLLFVSVPLILSELLVVNNQQATDSVTLRYTPTPQSSSHFDLYRFSLSDPNIPIKEKLANDSESKVCLNITLNVLNSTINKLHYNIFNEVK